MRERAAWFALAISFAAGCAQAGVDESPGAPDAEARDQIDAPAPGRPDAAPLADARPPVDASASAPDAPTMTVTPDAPPPPPDARPPDAAPPGTPDAPPCTPTWTNLLSNAPFDAGRGPPWMESSSGGFELVTNDFGTNPLTAHTPAFAAWMGGFDGANDDLWQQVAVPADATALRVSGVRLIGTADTPSTPFDYLYVRLRNSSGAVIETMATFSNVDEVATWTAFSANAAAAHAGETVQLLVKATNDFFPGTHTNFFVDSLVLEALVCR